MKEVLGRLNVRVIFFLTLALLPLGIIGVLQNQRLAKEVRQTSELSLLARAEQAISGEQALILRTFGMVQALSGTEALFEGDITACRSFLATLKQANPEISFAGFIGVSGESTCSTADRAIDFSENPRFLSMMALQSPTIEVTLQGTVSGTGVMILSEPRYEDGVLEGFVTISLPLAKVAATTDFLGDATPLAVMTFNQQGELLSTEGPRDAAEAELPSGIGVADLIDGGAQSFVSPNLGEEDRAYTFVPIMPGVAYGMVVWEGSLITNAAPERRFSAGMPILMWLASLAVVWFVTDRFVIAGIRSLNQRMSRFASDRTMADTRRVVRGTGELAELHGSFEDMAGKIQSDEAELGDRLREKSVLLKEVHHRVKNNLQVVSSIMNMQIRKARTAEAKAALRQVQDRIMGLSGVHQTLYQAENLSQVDASVLIQKIAEQSAAIGLEKDHGVQIETDLAQVMLFPDQAVPLAMLVSEALTNAIKYVGGADPMVKVSLLVTGDTRARLDIVNSRDADSPPADPTSFGLGQQLAEAFTSQLGGEMTYGPEGEMFLFTVEFDVETFRPAPVDY